MKTCDCFFDVGLFAKMNQPKCKEFHKMCTHNRTKRFFFLLSCQSKIIHNLQQVFYTKLFSNYQSQKTNNCMYWFDENGNVCYSKDIRIDDCCPSCQWKALVVFSKNLHDFNRDFCL